MAKNGLNLCGGMNLGGGGGGGEATVIDITDYILEVELKDNTIYNARELIVLTITVSATVDAAYISQVNFTSGIAETTLTAPNDIKWSGDDIDTNGLFVPAANTRYIVMIYTDGTYMRGVVQAVDIPVVSND